MKSTIYTFILFLLVSAILSAQEEYIQYNTENGFPVDQIYKIDDREADTKWMSTIGGGVVECSNLDELRQYDSNTSVLAADSVFSTFRDSKNNLWIATFGEGLVKVDADGWWHYYTTENSELPSNFVTQIVEDQSGNLFISTLEFMSFLADGIEDGGIVKIDNEGEWTHYSKDNSPLLSNNTFSLLVDEEDNLWIGTINAANPTEILDDGGGLVKLSKEGEWTVYTQENSGIAANNVMSLAQDELGNLYVGSVFGYISRFSPEEEWTINRVSSESFDTLRASILNMYYHDGDLYVGFGPSDLLCFPNMFSETYNLRGFLIYRNVQENFIETAATFPVAEEGEEYSIWANVLSNAHENVPIHLDLYTSHDYLLNQPPFQVPLYPYYPFRDLVVSSFHVDEQDTLWLATVGGGLFVFNQEGLSNPPEFELLETPETALATNNTGIASQEDLEINIYPNPVSDFLRIDFEGLSDQRSFQLRIMDLDGKVLYTQYSNEQLNDTLLDVSHLAAGLYFVQIWSENRLSDSKQFLVQSR